MAAHAFRPKGDLRSMPAMTAIIALRLLANENRKDLGRIWLDRCVERQFENTRVAVEQVTLELDLHAGVARLPDKIIDPGERRRGCHWAHKSCSRRARSSRGTPTLSGAAFRDKLATLDASPGMEPTDRFEAATGEVALTANERFLSPVENPPFDPLLSKPNAGRRRVPAKAIRLRDKEPCKYVATQPCMICGRTPAEAHHIRFAQPRALGRKVSDEYTVPVCQLHHRELHRYGDEASWWAGVGVDPLPIALELWRRSRSVESL